MREYIYEYENWSHGCRETTIFSSKKDPDAMKQLYNLFWSSSPFYGYCFESFKLWLENLGIFLEKIKVDYTLTRR